MLGCCAVTVQVSEVKLKGLAKGVTYDCVLKAHNSVGNSPAVDIPPWQLAA